ncbi:unnamed protein product [Didymodactylos carnosus]|uniref:Uncharacterized protein n=1 Tax=Didymodactylos carnosus TaxID=1234261 RepID=A0A813X1U2_9BILA|nr:unnamed protein product [Didymodactylos carnosus]CAF3648110.1 unnamed protein product [Didymodactylos carnosus]
MPDIEALKGTWDYVDGKDFDKFMSEIGVSFLMRQTAKLVTPKLTISENNGKWTLISETHIKTVTIDFIPDQEFDETTADGREVKSLIKFENGHWIHTSRDKKGKEWVLDRHVDEAGLQQIILTCGDDSSDELFLDAIARGEKQKKLNDTTLHAYENKSERLAEKFCESPEENINEKGVREKFQYVLDYISEQCSSTIDIYSLLDGDEISLSKLAFTVIFVAHYQSIELYDKTNQQTKSTLNEELKKIFDTHMIEPNNGKRAKLNIDNYFSYLTSSTDSHSIKSSILPMAKSNYSLPHETINGSDMEYDNLKLQLHVLQTLYDNLKQKYHVTEQKLYENNDYDYIREERDQLRSELRQCESEKQRLHIQRLDLSELTDRIRHYEKLEEQLQEETKLLENRLTESKQRCEELERCIIDQQSKMTSLSLKAIRQDSLEMENLQLKVRKEQMETELRRQIEILENNNKQLQNIIKEPKFSEPPLIVTEKRLLERELREIKLTWCDRKQVQHEIQSYKDTIHQYGEALEKIRKDYQEYKKYQIEQEQIKIDDEYQRFNELMKENEVLKRTNAQMDDECLLLRCELRELQEKVDSEQQHAETNCDYYTHLKLENDEQKQLIVKLQHDIKAVTVYRDYAVKKLSDIQNILDLYEIELDLQEEKETKLQIEKQTARQRYKTVLHQKLQLQNENKDLVQLVDELKKKIEETEATLSKRTQQFKLGIQNLTRYDEQLCERCDKLEILYKKTKEKLRKYKQEYSELHDDGQQPMNEPQEKLTLLQSDFYTNPEPKSDKQEKSWWPSWMGIPKSIEYKQSNCPPSVKPFSHQARSISLEECTRKYDYVTGSSLLEFLNRC